MDLLETCLQAPLLASNFYLEMLHAQNVFGIACLIVWNSHDLHDGWMYPLMTWSHYSCMTSSIVLSLVPMSQGCLMYLVMHLYS